MSNIRFGNALLLGHVFTSIVLLLLSFWNVILLAVEHSVPVVIFTLQL